MKKVWLFFLLLSFLALNTAMAGWLAPPPGKACHMMQMPSAEKCQMDQSLLMGDCLQSCMSHYTGLPVAFSFAPPILLPPVFNAVAELRLPDPLLKSPDKPPKSA